MFRLLVTTAMKPASDFTTPRRLIAPISRHFFPVEHPEPFCCTTGLKNGSRFPFIAHFFSSGLGCLESAGGLGRSRCRFRHGWSRGSGPLAVLRWGSLGNLFGVRLRRLATTGFAAGAFVTTATFAAWLELVWPTPEPLAQNVFSRRCRRRLHQRLRRRTTASLSLRRSAPRPAYAGSGSACRPRPESTHKPTAFSRSTTTLVVGGVLPSMPMRTPFTPALPTGILFCALATTVSGSSTTMRSGEFSLLTRGVTAWLELISIWTPSAPGTTFTFCSWLWPMRSWPVAAASPPTGVDPGIAAGFTAGAGAPGAGFAVAGTPAAFKAALVFLLLLQRFCHAARVVDGVRVLCHSRGPARSPSLPLPKCRSRQLHSHPYSRRRRSRFRPGACR